MTRVRIGAVVRCGDLVSGVYASVASLLTCDPPADVIAIVAERATPLIADAWLSAFARTRGAPFRRVDTNGPGGAWNAGLDAVEPVDFALCLEAGDTLDRSTLARFADRLSRQDSALVITSGVEWSGPGTSRSTSVPTSCAALDLLADPHAAHSSSMFRWADWRSEGGFDEDMPALEQADFWLRLLARGGVVEVEPAPLLKRRVHRWALYRRTWGTEPYRRATEMLMAKHHALASDHYGDLLERSDTQSSLAHQGYVADLARLRDVEREVEALRAQELLAQAPLDREAALNVWVTSRTSPLSHNWGYERGTPVDRPLIERFLRAHADDVRGVVLEIQEDDYTKRFGSDRVAHNDVLDLNVTNARATVVGDLRALDHLPSARYDCMILTQTLHVIDDMHAVLRECDRLLRPGGVLLATLPSASRVCLEYGPDADFWRVTEAGARRLFSDVFPDSTISTAAMGNAPLNAAFLLGTASEELAPSVFEHDDPYFPMVVGVRVQKDPRQERMAAEQRRSSRTSAATPAAILMYHRVSASRIDPHRLAVSPSTFRSQLEVIAGSCEVTSLPDLVNRVSTGIVCSKPLVAVTFDDGYVDNLSVAVPLLVERHLPATFFLTADDGPVPYYYWWDRLAWALLGAANTASLTVTLPSGRRVFSTSTEAERLEAHNAVYRAIVGLPADARDAVIAEVERWSGRIDPAGRDEGARRMTWEEARTIASTTGFSVGAHAVRHLLLTEQSDEVVREEVVVSRQVLESRIGAPIDAFAYPFGAFDARAVRAVRDSGVRQAVACVDRGVLPTDDPLVLPRVTAGEGPIQQFIATLERALGTSLS